MAKTTAPLLSFGADGQLAKTMVYSRWRGVPYVRRHVVPANPNTTAQQQTRSVFAQMRELWKIAPPGLQAPWDAFAYGRPFTGFNKFIGENVRVLRTETDFANWIASPGARGGLPAVSVSAIAGATGEIDVTAVAPAAPSGWTLDFLQAVCMKDHDPHNVYQGTIAYEENANPATGVTFTGLDTAEDYAVSAWLQWTLPTGKLAYSVSVTDIVAAG
jgi:hypothetical protein